MIPPLLVAWAALGGILPAADRPWLAVPLTLAALAAVGTLWTRALPGLPAETPIPAVRVGLAALAGLVTLPLVALLLHAAGYPVRPVPLVVGCAVVATLLGVVAFVRSVAASVRSVAAPSPSSSSSPSPPPASSSSSPASSPSSPASSSGDVVPPGISWSSAFSWQTRSAVGPARLAHVRTAAFSGAASPSSAPRSRAVLGRARGVAAVVIPVVLAVGGGAVAVNGYLNGPRPAEPGYLSLALDGWAAAIDSPVTVPLKGLVVPVQVTSSGLGDVTRPLSLRVGGRVMASRPMTVAADTVRLLSVYLPALAGDGLLRAVDISFGATSTGFYARGVLARTTAGSAPGNPPTSGEPSPIGPPAPVFPPAPIGPPAPGGPAAFPGPSAGGRPLAGDAVPRPGSAWQNPAVPGTWGFDRPVLPDVRHDPAGGPRPVVIGPFAPSSGSAGSSGTGSTSSTTGGSGFGLRADTGAGGIIAGPPVNGSGSVGTGPGGPGGSSGPGASGPVGVAPDPAAASSGHSSSGHSSSGHSSSGPAVTSSSAGSVIHSGVADGAPGHGADIGGVRDGALPGSGAPAGAGGAHDGAHPGPGPDRSDGSGFGLRSGSGSGSSGSGSSPGATASAGHRPAKAVKGRPPVRSGASKGRPAASGSPKKKPAGSRAKGDKRGGSGIGPWSDGDGWIADQYWVGDQVVIWWSDTDAWACDPGIWRPASC